MRISTFSLSLLLAMLVAGSVQADPKYKINLRLKAESLTEGENTVYTFESMGRLLARTAGNKVAGYTLDTFNRIPLPMTHDETKEEILEAPAGSIDHDCIEWRERCYDQKVVEIRVCDMVCTKIYDKATEQVVPVTDPEMMYIAITSDIVNFRESALKSDNPQYMKPRKRP